MIPIVELRAQTFFHNSISSSEFFIETNKLASFDEAQSACFNVSGHLFWNKHKSALRLIAKNFRNLKSKKLNL